MAERGFLSVSDFAKFSRTTRDTLHHYDKIGLLSPGSRGQNKYRYYSGGQFAFVNVIRTLRALGMSLAEIKLLKDKLNPLHMDKVLAKQIEKIDKKIAEWSGARTLACTLRKTIGSALDCDENVITVQFLPREAIILGKPNDYSKGGNDFDALLAFYNALSGRYPNLNLNYPVWGLFSGERVKRGDWVWPDRYYFYNPEGADARPASLYALGYTRAGYGEGKEVYPRLLDYIDRNGFEIYGDAYEEFPLNELCIPDEKNYLLRVMIAVREKEACHKGRRNG